MPGERNKCLRVETCAELVPTADPRKLATWLERACQAEGLKSILLVSHQPLLGSLLAWLCGVEVGRYGMATGSLAAVDTQVIAGGCAHLRWLQPHQD